MKTEFRNRVFLPIVVPLGILTFIGTLVGVFALILLYNTKPAALVLAIVAAAGVLVAMSLAASREKLDRARKGVVTFAALLPLLIGAAVALGLGGVDPALLNINREPIVTLPEWAPVVATDGPTSWDTMAITLPTEPPSEAELVMALENTSGVTHNLTLYDSPDDSGEVVAATENFAEGTQSISFEPPESGEYFYVCTLHPSTMTGTLTVEEGAEPATGG